MNKNIFKERRSRLIDAIKKTMPDKTGSVFLWANVVDDHQPFVQEATFYYFTGINEPGAVLKIDLDGKTRLFVPNTQDRRAQWIQSTYDTSQEAVARAGVDEIVYLGDPVAGYQFPPLFSEFESKNLINELQKLVSAREAIFTCVPRGFSYIQQQVLLTRLAQFIPQFFAQVIDISSSVTLLRRKKDDRELALIFQAVQATIVAQFEVMSALGAGSDERMLQAHIAATFAALGVQHAFVPMVAAGKNSCWPHYELSTGTAQVGDVVVVDCGAQCEHYCADLTRTYPVDGNFTKRQQEIYDVVLACQQSLVSLAKPGMYLSNREKPELSLHHHALEFFKERGLQDFVVHGVGHFLGLDVHDVGSANEPLQEGDVITIEPGLYLPKEGFGVRIEDDYWVIKDGVHCLSEELPKAPADLHKIMTNKEAGCGSCCSHTHND